MELLKEEHFRRMINGREVRLFTLRNRNGCVAQFTNYGARWLSAWMPDRYGQWADVVLGFETLDQYLVAGEKYHGAVVGRVCGRINKGQFDLDGISYQLAANDFFGSSAGNHLHGGCEGFSFKVWEATTATTDRGEEELILHYISKDGEEGYPGNLWVELRYILGDDNTVRLRYTAHTDQPTLVNLTNHAYFNLGDNTRNTVLDHWVSIEADYSVACDEALIPTGDIVSVLDTPLDFTRPQRLGTRIQESYQGQLFPGRGYALSYVLKEAGTGLRLAARVEDKTLGRVMEVYTDQPCLQLYNAWLFDGTDRDKCGHLYQSSSGLALEAQGYPDAPSHAEFPSIVLRPGEKYFQQTEYRFLID